MSLVDRVFSYSTSALVAGAITLGANSAYAGNINLEDLPQGCYINYSIKSGDTFSDLEKRYSLKRGSLKKLNSDIKPTAMQIGAKILIPDMECDKDKFSNESISSRKNMSLLDMPNLREDLKQYEEQAGITKSVFKILAGDNLYKIAKRENVDFNLLKASYEGDPHKLRPGKEIIFYGETESSPLLNLLNDTSNLETRLKYLVQLTPKEIWFLRSQNRGKDGNVSTPTKLAFFAGVTPGIGASDPEEYTKNILEMESTNNLILNYSNMERITNSNKNVSLTDVLTLVKTESGGLWSAISVDGAIGGPQFVKDMYYGYGNPYHFDHSLKKAIKVVNEDIGRLGYVLGISNHHIGWPTMKELLKLSDGQRVYSDDEAKKLLVLGFKKGIISKDNAEFFILFKKKEDWVKNNNYLDPKNSDLRVAIERKLYDANRVFEVVLPNGQIQRSYLTNDMWKTIEAQRKEIPQAVQEIKPQEIKHKTSTVSNAGVEDMRL